MKRNKIVMLMFAMAFFSIGTVYVFADSPGCQAQLGNYNTKVAVDEEFIYDIGTMGAAQNAYINEIYYVIQYDKDDLEVVNVNEKAAAAYNGWIVEAGNNANTGLRVNEITVHAYTTDKSKMYNSIISDEFVKIAYIKFKVKKSTKKTTSIELRKDISYYKHMLDNNENYTNNCSNSSITVVNIYSKDSNTSLSSLKVNNGELSPKFNANTTAYEVVVDNDVDTIQIDGTCSGTNCKLSGIGLKKIEVGENKFTITVTSENGTSKNYTVNVTRREKDEAYLQKLVIKDFDLYPTFNSQISNYIINVPNKVTKLDIEYLTNDDKINKVDIMGNDNLKVGKNYVTITVKNVEKKVEKTYEILVIKEDATVEDTNSSLSSNIYKILTIVFAVLSVAELIILIIKRKGFGRKQV